MHRKLQRVIIRDKRNTCQDTGCGLENINIVWMAVPPNRCMNSTRSSHNHSCLFFIFSPKNKMYKLIERCNWSRHVRDCKTNQIILSLKKNVIPESKRPVWAGVPVTQRSSGPEAAGAFLANALPSWLAWSLSRASARGAPVVTHRFVLACWNCTYLLKIGWWIP